ncbi:MAG: bifunctional riboflavin kinase/FAD synthetase [Ignavibacteria bacterium]|jgi:riboflavin kinase/FMN adenylyltransferase
MNIYRNIDDIVRVDASVISIGTFDGVHAAHRQIINKVLDFSRNGSLRSFIVTFDPHPQEVLKNKSPEIKLLTTTNEKLKLFEELGIENVFVITFTKEFSKTTAEDFYKKLIYARIGLSHLVVGYDHVFGRNREGSFDTLLKLGRELDFEIHRVEEIDVDGTAVSSTKIRHFLYEGNVEKANLLLGYAYGFEGLVKPGDKRGRTLGFPTVNVTQIADNKAMPKDGVYCVQVQYENKWYYGMMNIGYSPTMTEGLKKIMEINIFDFSYDIYNSEINVKFLKRLRDEKKFGSKEELIAQLKLDREQTLKYFNIKS